MSARRVNILCVLFLIVGYSSQVFIIWPWYHRTRTPGMIKLLLPFNFLVMMMLWNYLLTITTDPGRVPDDWVCLLNIESEEKLRYCSICEKYKPPRTHHCATCDRCVLRMDHHCLWLNCCVGYFNYGHYTRFFLYANLTCVYHLAMVSKCMQDNRQLFNWERGLDMEAAIIALNYLSCISILYNTLQYSTTHIQRLLRNRTIIEILQERKLAMEHKHMHSDLLIQEAKFPYDLGMRRNIASLLGASVYVWWWSCHTPGNGLSFPTVEGSGQSNNLSLHNVDTSVEEPWPPHDSHGNGQGIKNPASWPVREKVTYNLDAQYFDRNYHDSVPLKPRRAILFTTTSFATDENQAE
ncbi:DHHC palmitoyltransferase-domain-containing protein [Amanita rubescens]|nr:DHHC palmitoyltransferase-domain-containing protein [Amanita rubescens]